MFCPTRNYIKVISLYSNMTQRVDDLFTYSMFFSNHQQHVYIASYDFRSCVTATPH